MDWTFTLATTASGTVNGSHVFRDSLVRIELGSCRLGTSLETGRHFAVFNGTGQLFVDGLRFGFDPNRYGLLIECEPRPPGNWLTLAFGTVDSPLLTAGFALPAWHGLPTLDDLPAAEATGLNCPLGLEALVGDTLVKTTLFMNGGAHASRLTIRRSK